MKKTLLILLLGTLVTADLRSAVIEANSRNFTSEPTQRRRLTLTLIEAGPVVAGPWLIAGDSESQFTATNGVAYFSNVLAGAYRLDIAGSPGRSFPITVPDTNGVLSAAALVNTTNLNTDFYTATQVDALIAAGAGSAFAAADTVVSNGLSARLLATNTALVARITAATNGITASGNDPRFTSSAGVITGSSNILAATQIRGESINLTAADKSRTFTIDDSGVTLGHPLTATAFIGDGSGLTGISGGGTITAASLSDGTNSFAGNGVGLTNIFGATNTQSSNTLLQATSASSAAWSSNVTVTTLTASSVTGNGSGITNLIQTNIVDALYVGGVSESGLTLLYNRSNNSVATIGAAVLSGAANTIGTNMPYSVIVGGSQNVIPSYAQTGSGYSSILGGLGNSIYASEYGYIGGGKLNLVSGSTYSFIIGGLANRVEGVNSYILSGSFNTNNGTGNTIIGNNNTLDAPADGVLVIGEWNYTESEDTTRNHYILGETNKIGGAGNNMILGFGLTNSAANEIHIGVTDASKIRINSSGISGNGAGLTNLTNVRPTMGTNSTAVVTNISLYLTNYDGTVYRLAAQKL